jgi:predicted AlkP superfamily pyrophosphatase or phosphodiesterase
MVLTPVCVINVVGLTPRHVGDATPRLAELARAGGTHPLRGVVPAVTCSAQATMLSGELPRRHGIVGNGWFFRETGEVRFWLQSNRLMESEPVYATAGRFAAGRGQPFTCAKLFWWFNQGAAVDWSVTPKPYYGADGSKVFGISGTPARLAEDLEAALGPFPFHTFWGPGAGLPASQWIAHAATQVIQRHRPTLTLVYLPHLDYDLQRFGPADVRVPSRLREVDECAGVVADAAREIGAQVIVLSEYGLVPVRRAVALNRVLRDAGWLAVRDGPFGETLDTFASRAFAVADHQVAHVYVVESSLVPAVRHDLLETAGVAAVLDRAEQAAIGLDHARSGELVVLAERDVWFAYPYWQDERRAPDFARTVDIHRKPGYDPCELFLDPRLGWPKLRIAWRLAQKKLGMRYLMDVVPLDPSLVRGSHGLAAPDSLDGPVWIAAGPGVADPPGAMTGVREYLLRVWGLGS